ncbi:hypothetical protein [uncultured Jatrophihabitans sp.]|uniref:hypothetical protein n=1 Tax=uncultured Jatrophihabitans sp. TaxID=1610747 RepID=UPI0035CC992A
MADIDDEPAPPAPRPRPAPRHAVPTADEPAEELPTEDVATEDVATEDVVSPGPAHARARRGGRRRWHLAAAGVVVVAVVIAVFLIVRDRSGGSGGAGSSSSAADQSAATVTDSAAADAFVAGATSDVVAVTAYDYRSLDTTLSNGQNVTTGAYRTSFRTALTGSLAATARRLHRVQTFNLLAAGIGEMAKDGKSAKVLIFGSQSVTDDSTKGRARATLVTLTATMQREGNRYLVAGLDADRNAGLPAGTSGLRAAAEAGRSEVTAVLTLRHDHYDADYNTALAGAVDPLRSSLAKQSATARQRITAGGYDLSGSVTAVAVERALGDTLVMLVAATGNRTADGKTSVVSDGRYRVTVVRVSGQWVTSSIDAVNGT